MCALFGVAQYLISFVDLFEAFFSLFIVGVAIRMILHRQFAICLADLLLAGFALYTQYLIVIFVIHNLVIVITTQDASQAPMWLSNTTLILMKILTFFLFPLLSHQRLRKIVLSPFKPALEIISPRANR